MAALTLDALTNTVTANGYSGAPEGLFTSGFAVKYVFGANGLLAQQPHLYATQIEASVLNLPDATGGDPGHGFTCTGLAFDGTNYIIGNHGAPQEPGSVTHQCGIVKVSQAGVNLGEINLHTLYGLADGASVQGVAVDPVDGSYWAALISDGIKHVSTAGVALAGSFMPASGAPNGLCIDIKRDLIISLGAGSGGIPIGQVQLDFYNRSDQSFVKTITMGPNGVGGAAANFNSPDHLYYDAARDYIWITDGLNGVAGRALAYKAVDMTFVGAATFTNCTAIEGMIIRNGQFVLCHDGYYHGVTSGAVPAINQLQFYPAVQGFADVAWPVEYDPASTAFLGYKIEPAFTRTTGVPIDQESIGYGKANVTVTANNVTSPTGALDGNTITATASTGVHEITEGSSTTFSAGDNIVCSDMLKAGTQRYIWTGSRNNSPITSATFDLQTGTVVGSSNCTATIQNLGNGWYRCTRIFPSSGALTMGSNVAFGAATHTIDRPSQTLTGTETFLMYVHSIGKADFPTSPVFSSVSTSETRAADTATVPVTAWGFSPTVNTFSGRGTTARGIGTANQVFFQIDDNSASNRIRLVRDSSRILRFIVTVGGVEQCNLNLGTVADNTLFKFAIRCAANDFSASVNGGAVVTSASGSLPTVTTFRPGASFTGEQWGGAVQNMTLDPVSTDNATLVTMSSPIIAAVGQAAGTSTAAALSPAIQSAIGTAAGTSSASGQPPIGPDPYPLAGKHQPYPLEGVH